MNKNNICDVLLEINELLTKVRCDLMVFNGTFQITDADTEESYDFNHPLNALEYLENKRDYIIAQNFLINKKTI